MGKLNIMTKIKLMKLLKKIDDNGLILLFFFCFQPVINFIQENRTDQVFNFNRSIFYFFIFFFISILISFLIKLISKKNYFKILFYLGFFWFYSFNFYLINEILENLINKIFSKDLVGEISFFIYIVIFFITSKLLIEYLGILKIRLIFYTFIFTFVAVEVFQTLPNYYFSLNYKSSLDFEMPSKIEKNSNREINFPNVYFLIPDSMPAVKNYKNIFLENHETKVIQQFENLGFQFNENVKSHGLDSYTSIPYFFSMVYLFKKSGIFDAKVHVEINKIFSGFNPVVAEFRKRNYKYIRVDGAGFIGGCIGEEDICIRGKKNFLIHQDYIFLERSYLIKIINKLSKNDNLIPILRFLKLDTNFVSIVDEDKSKSKNIKIPEGYASEIGLRKNLQLIDAVIVHDSFEKILPSLEESPYFFHWWFSMPHKPIRFNENCELKYPLIGKLARSPNELDYEIWSDSHFGQTKCAEKQLVNFAKKILKHDPSAIIIIHSDHGFDHDAMKGDGKERLKRNLWSNLTINNMTDLFSTYKIPHKCKKYMDPNNSPVNLFKGIFACFDKKKTQFLEHKIFVVNEKHTLVEGLLKRNKKGDYKISDFNN